MIARIKIYGMIAAAIIVWTGIVASVCWVKGWNAHSAKVNRDYEQKRQKAEIKQAKSTSQINRVRVVTETKYKTIYRDVVKYVSDPNRVKCDFDDEYIRMRQSALNADSAISRDASGAVRVTEQGTKEH